MTRPMAAAKVKKVTISVPTKLYAQTAKKKPSFSGYVSSLIAEDLARAEMLHYTDELAERVGVTENDRVWAREQVINIKRATRKAS